MRTLGSLNPLFKALGATPVTLVQAELYAALQRGTVDALVYVYYGLEDYKFKEVVDYAVFPPVYMLHGGHLSVNMKAWNKLPDDLKGIVEDSCRWALMVNWVGKYKATVANALKEAEKVGVKRVTLPEEDVARMRIVARDTVWTKLAKKSPRCGDLVEMFESYLKEKGKW
jgi:TRAP-type C4-dicarboxylate transport system substrate-binding protein